VGSRRVIAVVLATLALALPSAAAGTTPLAEDGATFDAYGLGEAPGTICPEVGADCRNARAEPLLAAGARVLLAAAGTTAWRSRDGGEHFTALPRLPGSALALAASPHALYVLARFGADLSLLASANGGATWQSRPLGVGAGGRAALAAAGGARVCVSRSDPALGIAAGCSADGGLTPPAWVSTLDAGHAFQAAGLRPGGLAVDTRRHVLYQAYSAIAAPGEAASDHGIFVAVSRDGGATWVDHPAFVNPAPQVSYAQRAVSVAVDRAGAVYVVAADGHHLWVSASADGALSWTVPSRVDVGPGTALFPAAVAGAPGKLAVAYYKTPYSAGDTPAGDFPLAAVWWVAVAESTNALHRSAFHERRVSPVVRYGGLCAVGPGCGANEHVNGVLGLAVDPARGLVTAVFTSDQYDPQEPGAPGCTAATANAGGCVHVLASAQTSGPRLLNPGSEKAARKKLRKKRRPGR